jgi:ATP adenylyltransferase
MAYIDSARSKKAAKEPCLFCGLAKAKPGPRNLVLAVTPRVLVMMNLFPYNVGHVMVAPTAHIGTLAGLNPEDAAEMSAWLGRVEKAIGSAYRPHGFNLGMNLGRTAGAGVLGHLHWHIVPRWNGDTNFMPVLGDVRVLPEALDVTYDRLSAALDS